MLGLILLHTWKLHSSDFHSKGDFYILLGHLALSLEKGVLSISKFDIQK